MATLQDLINKLNKLPNLLKDTIPEQLEIATKDYLALQITKIRREGIGFKYSTKPGVPAYLMRGKELNGTGRAFIERKAKAKPDKNNKYANFINWQQLRNAQGLQTGFVDLSYSNQMLNNIGIISKQSSLTRYVANIGGLNPSAASKFGYNQARYGQFMKPSVQIRETVGKAVALRVGRFISNKLGAITR